MRTVILREGVRYNLVPDYLVSSRIFSLKALIERVMDRYELPPKDYDILLSISSDDLYMREGPGDGPKYLFVKSDTGEIGIESDSIVYDIIVRQRIDRDVFTLLDIQCDEYFTLLTVCLALFSIEAEVKQSIIGTTNIVKISIPDPNMDSEYLNVLLDAFDTIDQRSPPNHSEGFLKCLSISMRHVQPVRGAPFPEESVTKVSLCLPCSCIPMLMDMLGFTISERSKPKDLPMELEDLGIGNRSSLFPRAVVADVPCGGDLAPKKHRV
jgi:hypothetical protein